MIGIAVTASKNENQHILKPFAQKLETILTDAIGCLEAFTQAGFLRKLLCGTKPKQTFDQLDLDLTKCLNELSVALNLQIVLSQAKCYNAIYDVQQKVDQLGGLQGLQRLNDQNFNQFCQELGIKNAEYLKDEISMSLKNIEVGVKKVQNDVLEVNEKLDSLRKYLEDSKKESDTNAMSNIAKTFAPWELKSKLEIFEHQKLGVGSFGEVMVGQYNNQCFFSQ
jgi:hypothetical protein